MTILGEVVRQLLVIVQRQQGRALREPPAAYTASASDSPGDSPTA